MCSKFRYSPKIIRPPNTVKTAITEQTMAIAILLLAQKQLYQQYWI